jgi:hypothetical protein
MLRNNRNIEELTLFPIDPCGIATILEPLVVGTDPNHTLRKLIVYMDASDDIEEDDPGYARIADLLPQLTHLKLLTWDGNIGGPSRPPIATLVRAFEQNLSLTDIRLGAFFNPTVDEQNAIKYYVTRNKYRPLLTVAPKAKMLLTDFPDLQAYHDDETALSLMLDTLRIRDDWYATTTRPLSGSKRRRTTK